MVVNAISAFLTALIVLIFATVKFNEGAWVVVIVGPIMYFGLIRLHRQYVVEDEQLEEGASEAAEAPVLSRHEVVVLVDRLDMATARALQYARTLHPDELRAIHFALDPLASEQLEEEWRRLGLSDFPLDIQECEDRRLTRAALELAAETVADRQDRAHHPPAPAHLRLGLAAGAPRQHGRDHRHRRRAPRARQRHGRARTSWPAGGGRTGASGGGRPEEAARRRRTASGPPTRPPTATVRPRALSHRQAFGERARGTIPIGDAQWRQRVRVAGRVRSVRVQPRAGTSNLECLLADDSGMLLLVFQGRRRIPGIQPGARLVVEGMVGDWARRQAILNPDYELIAGPEAAQEPV